MRWPRREHRRAFHRSAVQAVWATREARRIVEPRQKPLLGSCALCAARCSMYCVVSMNRLAQFSMQLVSRPER
jgi:hypothetical protein